MRKDCFLILHIVFSILVLINPAQAATAENSQDKVTMQEVTGSYSGVIAGAGLQL